MSVSPIRGTRIGGGARYESAHGDRADRVSVEYFCAHGHVTQLFFAVGADRPEEWECARCGLPAGLDRAAPPPVPHAEPYKTHLAYVQERRTSAEAEALLAEALEALAQRRGS